MTDVPQRVSTRAFLRVIRAAVVLQVCLLQLAVAETARAQDGPLGQFLKDLFGPGEAVAKKQDLIDRHAASASRELIRTLEQTESLIATRQWDAAIRQLQFLIDLPEDALIQKRGAWVSIKRTAEQRLLTIPEDGRRAYLNQYAEAARDDLARARSSGDFAAICRVASRFRATPAGQSAADEVASLLADSGDLASAARWSLELSQDGVDVANAPEWKARVAAIWQALGRGNEQQPASHAPSAAASPQVSNRAWTELYGGPGRWNSVAADQPLLFEEWSSKSTELPLLQEEIDHRQADLFAAGLHPIPAANAVAADGRMAVRGVSGLEVRNVATGRLVWQARGQSTIESQYTQRGDDGATGMLFPGGDNHDSHPLSSFFYRDAAIGQLSTDGRRLYAISRKSTLLSSAYALFAIDSRAEDTSNRSFNSMVAIDFATGRNLWTIGGSKDEAPFEAPLAGVYFFGPPTVDGDELFVIGAAGADINLY
ncbi:MAG TPA: hypothetical protein VM452_15720, partial [Caulifigura sp.]|nr:hypothetical protein [Caulifigura sp.]